jgi:NAD(P)-dependent dehydrogenase (short-subunit alcohol dehydrogenase family)
MFVMRAAVGVEANPWTGGKVALAHKEFSNTAELSRKVREEAEKRFMRENRPSSLIERLIDPKEIADFVTYLSSPLASAINGAALRIDGGLVRCVF